MADTDGPAQPAPYRLRWYDLVTLQVASIGAGALLIGIIAWAGATAFLESYTGFALMLSIGDLLLLLLSLRCLRRDAALPVQPRPLSGRTWAILIAAASLLVWLSVVYEQICGALFHVDLGSAEKAMPLVTRHISQLPAGFVTIVLIGPAAEEVYFRGLLMGWLSRHWGMGWAIAGSALLFGLFHLEFLRPGGGAGLVFTVELVASGIVLGLAAARTGSLWASFAIHAVNNLCVMLLQFFSPF